MWKVYIKLLDRNGATYRHAYKNDDFSTCQLSDERETSVAELKEMESKGILVIFHPKAEFSEYSGFSYGTCAMQGSL